MKTTILFIKTKKNNDKTFLITKRIQIEHLPIQMLTSLAEKANFEQTKNLDQTGIKSIITAVVENHK